MPVESQIEPWSAVSGPRAGMPSLWNRSASDEHDVENDCPGNSSLSEGLSAKEGGADRQGEDRSTISGDALRD